MTDTTPLADNTPVIVGLGQYVERIEQDSTPALHPPMELAARAARSALSDAGTDATHIDTVAVMRLFSDSAEAWASPFGGSTNPPESIAKRIGATPRERIYSSASGAQPMKILLEMAMDIASGERDMVLLAGAEAIANQRFAMRNGHELDWREEFDVAMDSREHEIRMASRAEIHSGMFLPAHFYALIENAQASALGHDNDQHRQHMAQLLAPFSEVAAHNPYAQKPHAYSVDELVDIHRGNYLISHPFTKLLVAQDAVNQASALLLTRVDKARELGLDASKWLFVEAYAEGADRYLTERKDIGQSEAMQRVFDATLDMAGARASDMSLLDIYSCFPCAVHAAREALHIGEQRPLTVTGGLPFFGGPGNNYVGHAIAEMCSKLRGSQQRGLVTANGGILSSHAATVFGAEPERAARIDWRHFKPTVITQDMLARRQPCEQPGAGRVISYTVIAGRKNDDIGVVLCEDEQGQRFLASNKDPAVTREMISINPVGRGVTVTTADERHTFSFSPG